MPITRRAVIDIGTNSVKLLVADVGGGTVQPVLEESEQTRLGAGFYESKRLQAPAIAQTAQAVARFAALARGLGVVLARVIATSAARDAVNPGELASAIEDACALKVEIITGEQEAEWAFQGVITDPELARRPLLLLDVGGGSTEFILGRGERKYFRGSYPLGTVRLLESKPPGNPPTARELAACRQWVREFLDREVRPELETILRREPGLAAGNGRLQLVGTGGTATILARIEGRIISFDRERIEGARLNRAQIQAQAGRLWSLSLTERETIPGLPRQRADVILPGVLIYEGVMEIFHFAELQVSTRGLRFAAVQLGLADPKQLPHL